MRVLSLAPIAAVLLSCVTGFAAVAQTTPSPPERKVVVFGDAYSNAGNANRSTNPGGFVWIEQLLGAVPDPAFDPTTQTNGLIAPRSEMALFYTPSAGTPGANSLNMAYGGAFAWRQRKEMLSVGGQQSPNNVAGQIASFLAAKETLAADHMVFYMAGATDLIDQVFQIEYANTGQAYLRSPLDSADFAVAEAMAAITTLGQPFDGTVSGGLGAKHVVVLNLPDLSKTPLYGALPLPEVMQSATRAFNADLAVRLNALGNVDPDTTYVLVDVATAFDTIFEQEIKTPGSTGFTEFATPCVDRADICFGKFSDTNGNFFYNEVLPNSGAHAVIAQAVRDALLGSGALTQALARSLGLIK